jgi:hypothetical protein
LKNYSKMQISGSRIRLMRVRVCLEWRLMNVIINVRARSQFSIKSLRAFGLRAGVSNTFIFQLLLMIRTPFPELWPATAPTYRARAAAYPHQNTEKLMQCMIFLSSQVAMRLMQREERYLSLSCSLLCYIYGWHQSTTSAQQHKF